MVNFLMLLRRAIPLLSYVAYRHFRNVLIALILTAPAAQAAPITVLAFGDSLTQGYGLPPDQGFVPQLQAWLAAQGSQVTVINGGVSGDTTAGGVSRIEWSLTPEVGAVIVNLGGNDLLRGIDPALSRANLDTILAKVAKRHLPVLLVRQTAAGNYGTDYKAAFDAIYPDLAAKYGVLISDSYFLPLADPATGLLTPALMQADGIHPNADGVAKIVTALGPKVQQLLAQLQK